MKCELKNVLAILEGAVLEGDPFISVSGLTHDSRKVRPGWLFVAIPGETSDGHDYIEQAIASGAAAVLAEHPVGPGIAGVPRIQVDDTRRVLGRVASLIYGRPASRMVVVGITGTNGKTTLTFLLESVLLAAGLRPGVIGTISYRWGGREYAAGHTTPEASDLQRMLADMAADGVTHALLEVSSHGLHSGRLEGCDFDLGVFTNLTQDHLDYHGNLEEYYQAKKILFSRLLPLSCRTKTAHAVVNLDDPYGVRLAREIPGIPVTGYGTESGCTVHPHKVSLTAEGISGTVVDGSGSVHVQSRLTGAFNLLNILAAVAVSERLHIPKEAVSRGIEAVEVVPGRLERVPSERGNIFVDYAHTPDALKNVLEALAKIRVGRIVTVMGCGGDRDRTKRPIMGKEAAQGSDFVVVTSDNPRTEEPMDIIHQVENGVIAQGFVRCSEEFNGSPLKSGHYVVIPDRREAIAFAVKRFQDRDILLVAGKGHETYQEIGIIRYPFDDREVLREELTKLEDASQPQRQQT